MAIWRESCWTKGTQQNHQSHEYAADLYRSAYYSSRPPSQVGDIISLGMRSVLMPYGNHWRVG